MSIPDTLTYTVREPRGDAVGALMLFHGRGADEHDLFPLFDMLDPQQRLWGFCPRGPLSLPPGGAHWYVVRRVGYPDPASFHPTFLQLSDWVDRTLEAIDVPHQRALLGGFSQGAVMSHALTLGMDRPQPAGVLAFSGFIPTVDGFDLDLEDRSSLHVAIGHGTLDPVIEVEWGRDARDRLEAAGAHVVYRESPMPHTIDPEFVQSLVGWIEERV